VKIPTSLWNGEFREAAENTHKVCYCYGSKGDSDYVKDVAQALWGTDVLATHTVTGKPSNGSIKKKNGDEPRQDLKTPDPALEGFKIEAVRGKLKGLLFSRKT